MSIFMIKMVLVALMRRLKAIIILVHVIFY